MTDTDRRMYVPAYVMKDENLLRCKQARQVLLEACIRACVQASPDAACGVTGRCRAVTGRG